MRRIFTVVILLVSVAWADLQQPPNTPTDKLVANIGLIEKRLDDFRNTSPSLVRHVDMDKTTLGKASQLATSSPASHVKAFTPSWTPQHMLRSSMQPVPEATRGRLGQSSLWHALPRFSRLKDSVPRGRGRGGGGGRAVRIERFEKAYQEFFEGEFEYGLNDPELEGTHMMGIELHPQMTVIRVYVAGDQNKRYEIKAALQRARGYLRTSMTHQISTRHTPDIKFVFIPTAGSALAQSNRAMMADVAENGAEDDEYGSWAAIDPEEGPDNSEYVSVGVSLRRRPVPN